MNNEIRQFLIIMFEKWAKEKVTDVQKLPISGSDREYIRICGSTKSAIGTYNADLKENKAFIYYSKEFKNKGINVPEIYAEDLDNHVYLQEDLGDVTLFQFLTETYHEEEFPKELIEKYKEVLSALPAIQVNGSKNLDFAYGYPRESFDKQSMMWDLNYFKYYFLKLSKISFNEQDLERDFHTFIDYLLKTQKNYFLYRDFQSRNIMLKDNKVYFIDYQGGRQGALQYDLASLLYDAKANIPSDIREKLVDVYLQELSKFIEFDQQEFQKYYQGYVLIRIMQAMGAYGFRGFYEKKTHFLKSIPFALKNLAYILNNYKIPIEIPNLKKALSDVVNSPYLKTIGIDETGLNIVIKSFSYKKGLPIDTSGNGGGFIFDCRCLSNPGRYIEYKKSTGKDLDVVDFFEEKNDIHEFLDKVYAVVDMSVENYLERRFTNLMINFGCTGGQHRSVFCAERLAEHFVEKYNLRPLVSHTEHHLFLEKK